MEKWAKAVGETGLKWWLAMVAIFFFHDPTGTASLGPAIGGWLTMASAAIDAEMQKG